MSGAYLHLSDKPYFSHYLYVDTVIDHPVETVWPHVLNIADWMVDHRLETLAGKPGEVGHFERVWPRDLGEEMPPPHYHLYGVAKVIPLKLIALEVFPEKGGSYGNRFYPESFISFDNILLTDLADRTAVTLLMVGVSKEDVAHSADPIPDKQRISTLRRYLDNLRALVDDQSSSPVPG